MKNFLLKSLLACLAVMVLFSCNREESDSKDPTVFNIEVPGACPADATKATLVVKCDAAWTVSLVSDASWLRILSADKNAGGGSVLIGMEFNLTDVERSAELEFTSGKQQRTVRLRQQGLSSILDLSALHFVEPETRTVKVTMQAPWKASISDGAEWYKISPASGAAGTTSMTVTVSEAFIDKGVRSSAIRFTVDGNSFDIPVIQGQKDVLMLMADVQVREHIFTPEGGILEFKTRTNVGNPSVKLVFEGGTAGGWISHLATRALDEYVHSFSVSANETGQTRRADIIFISETDGGILSDTLTVIQRTLDPLMLNNVIGTYGLSGGDRQYQSGAHLLSRLYSADETTVNLRIIDPEEFTVLELGGIPTDAGLDDRFTLTFRLIQLGESSSESRYSVSVIKVGSDEKKDWLWLRAEEGPGFIVKK